MKLLTHSKFIHRRNEIERRSFDDLYNSLEQYVDGVSSFISLTENMLAIRIYQDLGHFINMSKMTSLTLNERLWYLNLINANVQSLNMIIMQSVVVDDQEPSLVDTAKAADLENQCNQGSIAHFTAVTSDYHY